MFKHFSKTFLGIVPRSNLNVKKIVLSSSSSINYNSFRLFSSVQLRDQVPCEPKNNSLDLPNFMKQVSLQTSKNLLLTGISGGISIGIASNISPLISSELLLPSMIVGYGGAFLGSLYCAYKLGNNELNDNNKLKYNYLMHSFMGISISPSLFVFSEFIPQALALTSVLVLTPITLSFYAPKGYFLRFGPALYTSLWGLIGLGIGGIFFPILHDINLYLGLGIFVVYNAYDTHILIDEFEKGNRDYILHSVNYSLNFINIFLRILQILAKIQKK